MQYKAPHEVLSNYSNISLLLKHLCRVSLGPGPGGEGLGDRPGKIEGGLLPPSLMIGLQHSVVWCGVVY